MNIINAQQSQQQGQPPALPPSFTQTTAATLSTVDSIGDGVENVTNTNLSRATSSVPSTAGATSSSSAAVVLNIQNNPSSSSTTDGTSGVARPSVVGLNIPRRPPVRATPKKIRFREELLQSTGKMDNFEGEAKDIFGGHGSHILWLENTRVLAFAGNFYPQRIGGATPIPLTDIYDWDVSETPPVLLNHLFYGKTSDGVWPYTRYFLILLYVLK